MDGTLVTHDKILTDRAIAAVHHLREAGVLFAITSGRPPRGMEMLVEPLDLQTPIAAFNGGEIVDRAMKVLEQHTLPEDLVVPLAEHMASSHLDVWLYRGAEWYVPDPKAPHVDREAWTVKFEPKVMHGFDGLTDGVVKLVGVSDDHEAIEAANTGVCEAFGDHVTAAASQPYYLDVTHPDANKGFVAQYLARRYQLQPGEIATIGDQPNDILMFAHSRARHRDGQCRPAGEAGRTAGHQEQRGRGLRVRRRALRAPGGRPYTPRWFSKRAYCLRNSRLAFPVGPLRCFATSISASSARSMGTSSLYSDSR